MYSFGGPVISTSVLNCLHSKQVSSQVGSWGISVVCNAGLGSICVRCCFHSGESLIVTSDFRHRPLELAATLELRRCEELALG